jgi:hypothetical protein
MDSIPSRFILIEFREYSENLQERKQQPLLDLLHRSRSVSELDRGGYTLQVNAQRKALKKNPACAGFLQQP